MQGGTIYIIGNGQLICDCCAGFSVKTTGRDIDGSLAEAVRGSENVYFKQATGRDMVCKCGKVSYA